MSSIKRIVKFVLPMHLIYSAAEMRRAFIFRRAMQKFMSDPEGSIAPGSKVISRLIYGWGNESWSADTEYIVCCIKHALTTRGPILECGSGLTTLLLAVVAQKTGAVLWSLEHKSEWSERVTAHLARLRIKPPHIHAKALRDYGEFSWYDPPMEALPEQFSLVVCDGPPSATPGGRYGLAPRLGHLMGPGCVILLDDAERAHERAIADRWSSELNAKYQMCGTIKPYIQLNI